jgi:hypothetical protein
MLYGSTRRNNLLGKIEVLTTKSNKQQKRQMIDQLEQVEFWDNPIALSRVTWIIPM